MFPLHRGGGVARDVADYAAYAADFVDYADGDAVEQLVRDAGPVGGHEVVRRDGSEDQIAWSFEAESGTVGGWTLEMFGGFPKAGDSFRFENMTVTVLSMVDGRRVDKILVKVDKPEEKDE